MNELYEYEDGMLFDFIDSLPEADRDDSQQETARDTQEAIIDFFTKMSKYNLFFKLGAYHPENPSQDYDFTVIGTRENLDKWDKEVWLNGDVVNNLKPFGAKKLEVKHETY